MENKEPITSGFGTSDLFDNQLLKKTQAKITYNSIINKVFAKRRRIGMQINNSGMKINTFNPPTKFTFRHKESITDLVSLNLSLLTIEYLHRFMLLIPPLGDGFQPREGYLLQTIKE